MMVSKHDMMFDHMSGIDFGLHHTFNQLLATTITALQTFLVHMLTTTMDHMPRLDMHNCALTMLTTQYAPQVWRKLMCSFFAQTGVHNMAT